jgi:hypothetical protein
LKTNILVLVILISVGACKTTEDAPSDAKAIYKSGLTAGETIGPLFGKNETMTLINCKTLAAYETVYKAFSGKISDRLQHADCQPLNKTSSTGEFRAIWIAKKNIPKFKKQINDALWKKCLREQFWFCDDSKIKREIDAAFSPGEHLGRILNGSDWIKTFWDTANLEAQSLQTP